MESELIMGELPYPQNYNGNTFQSILPASPKRSSVPFYLRSDLPSTEAQSSRRRFKQFTKFMTPSISFIKESLYLVPKALPHLKISHPKEHQNRTVDRKKARLISIREGLKYALVMADRASNVVEDLLSQSKKIEEELSQVDRRDLLYRKKKMISLANKTRLCFPDTANIVFNVRKKQLLAQLQKSKTIQVRTKNQVKPSLSYDLNNQ